MDNTPRTCATCGHLSVRSYPGSFLCASQIARDQMDFSLGTSEGGTVQSGAVACARHVIDIQKEISEAQKDGHIAPVAYVIKKERPECAEKWCLFTDGYTPKEHLREQQMLELEQMRRRWEAQQAKDHREFMKALTDQEDARTEAREAKWRDWEEKRDIAHAKEEASHKKQERLFAFAAIALAVAQVLTMTSDSLIAHWLGFHWDQKPTPDTQRSQTPASEPSLP
jgi:hypothetical protein